MKKLIFVFLLITSVAGRAQQDSIAYSHEFDFKEGVYLTYYQFKHNLPIPVSAIVSSYPKTQLDFLTEVTDQKFIEIKDAAGNTQKVESSTLWGYCRNRSVYVNFNKQFNKLNTIGTLCYFTSSVTCSTGMPDPMGMPSTYEELRQFVYDTKTNKVYDFNVKNMEELLKNDEELYNKFMAMKKREKADVIFVLLRKYNERHPFYILK